MERRKFMGSTLAGGALVGGAAGITGVKPAHAKQADYMFFTDDLVVERDQPGQPHKGKVLAAIQPHADDIPGHAAGTVAKLIKEGYTGYLINTTNDDAIGSGTVGETMIANEKDWNGLAKALGLKKVYCLGYRNHRMDGEWELEMRARLIFLFRLLKVDTAFCHDPMGHYDANPDHYVTARAVEAAGWMAAAGRDYPEYTKAGIKPHRVRDIYYYGRGPQYINRVVEISSVIDKVGEANAAVINQGGGNRGALLRARLAKENKKLPVLGDDDHTANVEFVKQFRLGEEKKLGEKFGLEYAEAFYHYTGHPSSVAPNIPEYIKEHAVKL